MATPLGPRASYRSWHAIARLLTFITACFLCHDVLARGGGDFRDRSVIGKWKLVSVLDLAAIASLDETDAKAMLGKYVTISATAVKVDEEVCSPPEFWAERIVPEPHMQDKLHSTAERLRLPNPATMVELGCTDVYIRNPAELVLLWGGAMFEAVRIIPKAPLKQKSAASTKQRAGKAESGKGQAFGKSSPKNAVVKKPGVSERKQPVAKASPAARKPPKNRRDI